MNKDNSTYKFNIPALRQAEDIVQRNSGDSLPHAFTFYAEEIVHQGRYPAIHKAETALSANDYAYRLDKVNKALDAVMRTLSQHSSIAVVRAQAAWDIRMCLAERRHCKRMLADLAERKAQFPETAEHRKGA
ncbi:hypothetical protein OBV_05630 [Oscillibacter valericigenes Sjm18-20]|nr:hypothetical protein OBV_05630 [Oscillibacter valericigenes Sjm18-20]